MKLYKIILVMGGLFFTGCTVQPQSNLYTSTASHEYKSASIETDFVLMPMLSDEEKESVYGSSYAYPQVYFRVISAVDNKQLHYTLIAPTKMGSIADSINDVYLYHAITLTDEKAKELLTQLDNSIEAWDNKLEDYTGYSSTFEIVGEQTKMSYNFQANELGSIAFMRINTGKKFTYVNQFNNNTYEQTYNYEFKYIEDLKLFRHWIQSSLETNL